jgi:hypothetical protein
MVSELLNGIIGKLHSVGLRLAAAQELVGDHPAQHELASAVAELDEIIRDARLKGTRFTWEIENSPSGSG